MFTGADDSFEKAFYKGEGEQGKRSSFLGVFGVLKILRKISEVSRVMPPSIGKKTTGRKNDSLDYKWFFLLTHNE